MKKTRILTGILCIILAAVLLTACSGAVYETSPTTATSAAEDETKADDTATAAALDDDQDQDQADDTDDAYGAEVYPPQVILSEQEYRDELVNNTWLIKSVTVDGQEMSPSSYYGTMILQTGGELTFSQDGSFLCNLGSVSCEGTYSLDTGVATVTVTKSYTAAGETSGVEYDETLLWDYYGGTIDFIYGGARNHFVKK